MTKVKICGVKTVAAGLAASEAGADFLGFIFAPSRRRIEPETAREIVRRVRNEYDVAMVGVFVNAPAAEMRAITSLCRLDYVQLSGEEDQGVIDVLDTPVIKTFHVSSCTPASELHERALASNAAVVHFDNGRDGSHGGSGRPFDWDLIPRLDRPVLLSGGLTSVNVGDAISRVRPWGVDVSSGVERGGEKDPELIRDFLAAVGRTGTRSTRSDVIAFGVN